MCVCFFSVFFSLIFPFPPSPGEDLRVEWTQEIIREIRTSTRRRTQKVREAAAEGRGAGRPTATTTTGDPHPVVVEADECSAKFKSSFVSLLRRRSRPIRFFASLRHLLLRWPDFPSHSPSPPPSPSPSPSHLTLPFGKHHRCC